jgi:hypothetical protein
MKRKFLLTMMAFILTLGFSGVMATTARAGTAADSLASTLNTAFKQVNYGGNGITAVLNASTGGTDTVAITGPVAPVTFGATLNMNIPSGVTVSWRANVANATDDTIYLYGSGIFQVDGGSIATGASNKSAIYAEVASSITINVTGGTVQATGTQYSDAIHNNGSAVNISQVGATPTLISTISSHGSGIYAPNTSSTVTVTGGTVQAIGGSCSDAIYARGSINISQAGAIPTVIRTTSGDGSGIYTDNASSTVNVTGGTVQATGADSSAIAAEIGNINVSQDGAAATLISAFHYAIASSNKNNIIKVSGGTVEATGPNNDSGLYGSDTAIDSNGGKIYISQDGIAPTVIRANGGNSIYTDDGMITISGGTVISTASGAIYTEEVGSVVSVTGGTVQTTCQWLDAIEASGDVNISQSGATPTLISATTGAAIGGINVTVTGGTVRSTGDGGYAIYASGNVNISQPGPASTLISSVSDQTIYESNANTTITITGGTVQQTGVGADAIYTPGNVNISQPGPASTLITSASKGRTICTTSASGTITVTGGTVKVTGTDVNSRLIVAAGDVNISNSTLSVPATATAFKMSNASIAQTLTIGASATVTGGNIQVVGSSAGTTIQNDNGSYVPNITVTNASNKLILGGAGGFGTIDGVYNLDVGHAGALGQIKATTRIPRIVNVRATVTVNPLIDISGFSVLNTDQLTFSVANGKNLSIKMGAVAITPAISSSTFINGMTVGSKTFWGSDDTGLTLSQPANGTLNMVATVDAINRTITYGTPAPNPFWNIWQNDYTDRVTARNSHLAANSPAAWYYSKDKIITRTTIKDSVGSGLKKIKLVYNLNSGANTGLNIKNSKVLAVRYQSTKALVPGCEKDEGSSIVTVYIPCQQDDRKIQVYISYDISRNNNAWIAGSKLNNTVTVSGILPDDSIVSPPIKDSAPVQPGAMKIVNLKVKVR